MKTIGVISDTHGLLRPEAVRALEGSQLILHAGDVGREGILEDLAHIAPVCAVRGNTDHGLLWQRLPETLVVDLGADDGRIGDERIGDGRSGDERLGDGRSGDERLGDGRSGDERRGGGPFAYLLHDPEDLDLDPGAADLAVVVTGHTHRPLIQEQQGVLYLNPGSAGPRRFDLPVTLARITLHGRAIRAEIVELLR